MKALSLFFVFLVARVVILVGRDVPLSLWAPAAYLWQDLLVVLLFAGADRLARRAWITWTIYGSVVLYVALNLPLTRLLSSPLTLPMLRATRGTLGDSIEHHLTLANFALMGLVAGQPPRACTPPDCTETSLRPWSRPRCHASRQRPWSETGAGVLLIRVRGMTCRDFAAWREGATW